MTQPRRAPRASRTPVPRRTASVSTRRGRTACCGRPSLLRYAQDLAWFHSASRGFDRDWYAERGLTWLARAAEVGRGGAGSASATDWSARPGSSAGDASGPGAGPSSSMAPACSSPGRTSTGCCSTRAARRPASRPSSNRYSARRTAVRPGRVPLAEPSAGQPGRRGSRSGRRSSIRWTTSTTPSMPTGSTSRSSRPAGGQTSGRSRGAPGSSTPGRPSPARRWMPTTWRGDDGGWSCRIARCSRHGAAAGSPGRDLEPRRGRGGLTRIGGHERDLVDVDHGLVADRLVDLVRGRVRQVGEEEDEPATLVELCLAGRGGERARVAAAGADPVACRPARYGSRSASGRRRPRQRPARRPPTGTRCGCRSGTTDRPAPRQPRPRLGRAPRAGTRRPMSTSRSRSASLAMRAVPATPSAWHDPFEPVDPLGDPATSVETVRLAPALGELIRDSTGPVVPGIEMPRASRSVASAVGASGSSMHDSTRFQGGVITAAPTTRPACDTVAR